MAITSLKLKSIGPFNEIHFDFDPNVNVFLGPNNTGKSTALIALGDIAVYPFSFPKKIAKTKSKRNF